MSKDTHASAVEQALCAAFGIEREVLEYTDGRPPTTIYWVAADPGPVQRDTLAEALSEALAINVYEPIRALEKRVEDSEKLGHKLDREAMWTRPIGPKRS